jgi:hypothetical protein
MIHLDDAGGDVRGLTFRTTLYGGRQMAVVNVKSILAPVGSTGAKLGSVDMGGMSVLAHRMPAGVDYTELLRAACGDVLCPVPHYFIVSAGKLGIRYTDDGSEETASAGDVAYLRPGHNPRHRGCGDGGDQPG